MRYEIRAAQYEDGKLSGWTDWQAVETDEHGDFAEYVKVNTAILADLYADGVRRAVVEVREARPVRPSCASEEEGEAGA